MRINRLEIAGFGPYKNRQVVDFDAYDAEGIFLISGKTGAGKSSILDAICFALYNAVPRYDGTDKQLRSHHAELNDPSEVTLEFTVADTRYRVVRTPEYERPKKSGGGTTTQKADAELFVQREGQWEGLAARAVDVGLALDGILGLKKDQFLQVILLAQNRFQQFLLAKNEERQEVLQALFGTQRFSLYEQAIVERARALEAGLADSDAQRARDAVRAADLAGVSAEVSTDAAWFEHGLVILAESLEAATEAVAQHRIGADAAETALRGLEQQQTRSRRRADAEAALARVEAERPKITAASERLALSVRAAIVEPHVLAVTKAQKELDAAAAAEESARNKYAALDPADMDDTALAERIDTDSRTLGALEAALAEELGLPALERDLAATVAAVEALATEQAQGAERAAELPVLLQTADSELSAARIAAALLPEASATLDRLQAQLAAATIATSVRAELVDTRQRELAASTTQSTAAAHLTDVLGRQLHGRAAVLAASLTPGEPCAVCGSTEHPAPAAPTDDAVSDDDVDAANARVDAARGAYEVARETAARLAEQLAAAVASAGTVTVDLLSAAKEAQDEATAAAKRVPTLEAQLQALISERDAAATERAALHERLQTAELSVASARERLEASSARVATHRGEFASVGERAASLRATIAAATALQAAVGVVRQREESLSAAIAGRDAQLAEHGFESPAAASAALIAVAQRTELERRVRVHGESEAVARATLAEPELHDVVPVDPDDLASATQQRDATRGLLATSTGERGAIDQRHRQYEQLLGEVRARDAEVAARKAEYDEIASLAAAVRGENPHRMKLETYVLAAQLEEIVAAANARLSVMTAGRYELQHDDAVQYRRTQSGLGVAVLDQHTGRPRSPHSLSGGETFLASLALALGLADVVTSQSGGITLESLFVDEGFGSLDADTLEIAMSTLDSLRAGGRTIGLISHVEAMKEQIPAKLEIRVAPGGWSEIVQA